MDSQLCQSAVARQFPGVDLAGFRLLGEGGVCAVFETDGGIAWRFLKQPEWQAGLDLEIGLLPDLALAISLPIPHYEYVSDPAISPRFVGYPKIEGEPFTRERLAACRDDWPIRQLAQFLTELHRFPIERAQAIGVRVLTPDRRRAERIEWNEKIRQHVLPLLDERQRARASRVMSELLNDDTLLDYTPALCHGDLWAEHVLFNTKAGELAGVIDWESACCGDPAGDWVALCLEYGDEVVERVLAHYNGPVNPTLRHRVRRLASFVPLNEILCGVLYGDRASWQAGWARLAQA
jgi:aminoglycoside 2''-phosphotransferase